MRQPSEDVCVVIPMFNEAEVIQTTIADVRRYFSHVVCVDDGSTDESVPLALETGATVIRHPFNLGQGAALRTGLRFAIRNSGCGYIVTFDADGQHCASDAARMVRVARETGAQAVLGSRFMGMEHHEVPRHRVFLLRAALWLTRTTSGLPLSDTHNGLRVLTSDVAARLNLRQAGMAHASEILHEIARLGLTIREEPVTVRYSEYSRNKGQSSLNAVNILHDLMLARLRLAK